MPADLACRGCPLLQKNPLRSGHSFRCSSESLLFACGKRVRSNRTFRNRRLLLLLEQILEDEQTPSLAACVDQRATLVELSQLDGREPELFGQIRHGSDSVLVVARQEDDPVAALDDWVGSQGGRNQMIKTLHQLGTGERLRHEGGGRETVQLLRWDWKR